MKSVFFILIVFLSFNGFSQIRDSGYVATDNADNQINSESQHKITRMAVTYIPPAVFIGYGFMSLDNRIVQRIDHSVHNDMQEDHPGFSTSIDNYLQYAPSIATGILSISGMKGKHSFIDQTALFAITTSIVSSSVTFFKRSTNKFRPNQSSNTSFPSGHTTTAFAAAEFLNQEYGDKSIWFGIAGYTAATTTGILRVYNNAHWFSDIIAGAGFGILSAKASYLIYPYLNKLLNPGKTHFTVTPAWQKGYSGISVHGNF